MSKPELLVLGRRLVVVKPVPAQQQQLRGEVRPARLLPTEGRREKLLLPLLLEVEQQLLEVERQLPLVPEEVEPPRLVLRPLLQQQRLRLTMSRSRWRRSSWMSRSPATHSWYVATRWWDNLSFTKKTVYPSDIFSYSEAGGNQL